MSDDKLFIPVLLGTPRQGRQSEKVARWLLGKMQARSEELETELFDVRDFRLPTDDYGMEIKADFPLWRDAMTRADGLVIVTPEYNHGYPGALKSVLDLLLPEYIHKAVAFASVSAQVWGGVRVIEALVQTSRELGFAVTFTDLNFPRVHTLFDENGDLIDEKSYENRTKAFLDELIWMSRALRWGRQNLPSKYHQK